MNRQRNVGIGLSNDFFAEGNPNAAALEWNAAPKALEAAAVLNVASEWIGVDSSSGASLATVP